MKKRTAWEAVRFLEEKIPSKSPHKDDAIIRIIPGIVIKKNRLIGVIFPYTFGPLIIKYHPNKNSSATTKVITELTRHLI